jgi:acyl carrier protein
MSGIDFVFKDVQRIVAETLAMEPEMITPDSHWEYDLGGDSLDFLDLSSRLKREFDVNIKIAGLVDSDLQCDEYGFLTQESLQQVRRKFPYFDLDVWEAQPFTRPLDLITIGSIATLVRIALLESALDTSSRPIRRLSAVDEA